MDEDVVRFDLKDAPRSQKATHAHVGNNVVTFHTHAPEAGEGQHDDITMGLETLRSIAGQLYWKKLGVVGAKGETAGENLKQADCQIGYVVLEGDGFREIVGTPSISLIVAVLQGRREAERRRAMMTHESRVSKHLGGTYP